MKRIILIALMSFLLIDYSYSQSLAYDNLGSFGKHGIGWVLVQKNQKFGCINTKGEEIVPIKYDNIGNFRSHGIGWALVQKDKKVGFINTKVEAVVPLAYDNSDEITR